ncbi:mechanosensitive ion channel [Neiella marina]|uniref:Mechanosensitive ion channel n=1 Tax=Neiella holothuriorum TaxID=2870530 RepID=A0ABS7ED42_9GAMM|nr:mechanosensitive ion channel domain-containing protein [Neiella holothuriorum]MBW8190139.1 mechanosensitive ion channel [Neiella holothuriorum]
MPQLVSSMLRCFWGAFSFLCLMGSAGAAPLSLEDIERIALQVPASEPKLAEIYQETIHLLNERDHFAEQANDYRNTLAGYAESVIAARERAVFNEQQVDNSLKLMNETLLVEKIGNLNADITITREQLQGQQELGEQIQNRMVELPLAIDNVAIELDSLNSTELEQMNSAGIREARQFQQDARREMLQAQHQMLQLEASSATKQIELNRLATAQTKQVLDNQVQTLRLANQQLALLRQQNSEKALADMNLASAHMSSEDTATKIIIDRNIDLTQALKSRQLQLQDAQLRYQGLYQLSAQINSLLRELRNNIDRFEPSVEFSSAIIEQLAALSSIPSIQELSRSLNQLRVDSFSYRNELRKNRQHFQRAGQQHERELLETQYQLLSELSGTTSQLELLLKQALINIDQLTVKRAQLEEQAFRLLTWIPNIHSVRYMLPQAFAVDAASIYTQLSSQWRVISERPGAHVFPLVFLFLLLVYLRRFCHQYDHYMGRISDRIGNVKSDKGHYSVVAICGLLALGCMLPLGSLVANWLANHSTPMIQQLTGLAAIAVGLHVVARQVRQDNGVFIHHFRLKPKAILLISQYVIWLSPLFLSVLLLYRWLLDGNSLALFSESGRFLHLINALMLTWATVWLFRLVSDMVKERGHVIRLPLRMLWWFGIAVPAFTSVLLLLGYVVAAQMLLIGYMWTLVSAVVICLLYYLSLRGIAILYRRMAFERALAKRAALLAAREEAEEGTETTIEEPQESYIEFDDIGAQASKLLRTTFVLLFYFSLLPIWNDAFDSLSALNDLTLWTVKGTDGQGQLELTTITIKVLLTAMVTGAFTLVSVRNVPGMLELLILQRMQLSPGTGYAITTISKYLILVVGVLVVVGALGFSWSSLQWLVAALTVGLGFGLQEIFANFVSGLIILFEKPIRIGDTVTIRGMSGTVTRINTRATTVVDWDRKEIIIPNKAFITEDFVNWSLSDAVTRIVQRIGVRHNSDVRLVTKLILQAADECDLVIDEPIPEVFLLEYSDSSLIFELRAYTSDTAHRLPSIHDIHSRVIKKFAALGVEVAHPQLDVHVKHAAGLSQAATGKA